MSALPVLATTLLAGSGESKKSGPLGLAVILLLCVACYFLFKSMSKHLRKVREEFPGDPPAAAAEPPAVATSEPAADGEVAASAAQPADAAPPAPPSPTSDESA